MDGATAQALWPEIWLLSEDVAGAGDGPPSRLRQAFALPGGLELRVDRLAPGGRLRRFTVEIHTPAAQEKEQERDTPLRPALQAVADGGCALQAGRAIRQPKPGLRLLDHLDGDLQTRRWTETLEAPWPDGDDPGGPRVVLIDSGLAYDAPLFRNRLARGPDGAPLGFDFWDLDPYPYDGDTSRGAFLPIRHGTPVASVLAREAPTAALIPYRYPRPDMTRLTDAVVRAASAGARIVAMPLGSRDAADFEAFTQTMRAHPQILAIVSAGNDGRDIDAGPPLWPASSQLDNMIVVTSSDPFGRLAEGSNWGPVSVDLMTPAENTPVVDFRGSAGRASGSSYAVPRIAALAARLLAQEPELTAAMLKARIFARAEPSAEPTPRVLVGWIADPTDD